MTTARKQLVAIEATRYYHCVSRCVRRSFLCGTDTVTNKCYEHRRDWIEQKIQTLTHVFCIDVCAYAVMSNHYHLVVHINYEQALTLTPEEVVKRWRIVHKLPMLVLRWVKGELSSKAEVEKCHSIINQWRERLWSLSWFMKELNFDIACRANQEDDCKGHFWESRFKSQALLDEKALLAAMAYVDLNPVRAGISETPEQSEYTSIKQRLDSLSRGESTAPCLHPFIGHASDGNGLPFRLIDYIELVDWTARQFRDNKTSMNNKHPPILERLTFSQSAWLKVCNSLERKRATAVGVSGGLDHAKMAFKKTKIHCYRLE